MRLPKIVFILVCLLIMLTAFAANGLTEAGEAYGGGAQITVLRNGEPISMGPSFETYGKFYLTPEPTSFTLLICLLILRRRNL
ncbi:hypothetical protein J5754_02470 [bacterium]|nr:hypothetical protein [bacterium]